MPTDTVKKPSQKITNQIFFSFIKPGSSSVVAAVILTAVVVGSDVFLLQQQSMKQAQEKLQTQINTLQNDLQLMQTNRDELKAQIEQAVAEKEAAESEKERIERLACKGVWKNGVCVKSTCVDSDVNEKPKDIYIKGYVTTTDENGISSTVYDECTDSKRQVNEMWCYESPAGSGNYVQGRLVYNCPRGCLDGACIK